MHQRGPEKAAVEENNSLSAQPECHPVLHQRLNFSRKASDWLTVRVGSWTFIIFLLAYILLWVSLNLVGFVRQWDPWPFIVLNLTLSCLAAIQAPIILMSHNRQTESDRIDARYDHAVNRKAERENRLMMKDLALIKKKLGI